MNPENIFDCHIKEMCQKSKNYRTLKIQANRFAFNVNSLESD